MKRYLLGTNENLRDLGGFITSKGEETKYFKFIRSDLPQNFKQEDVDFLKKNNITTVIDLRKEEECLKEGNCLKKYFDYYNISLIGDKFPNKEEDIASGYINILDDFENIKKVLKIILSSKGGIIYNCTAGKDRTGVISMLLLIIADIPESDIIADYEVSYTYIRGFIRKLHNINSEWPAFVGRSNMETMEQTLEQFYKKYGNIDNYLKLIKLSQKEIVKLKKMLISKD